MALKHMKTLIMATAIAAAGVGFAGSAEAHQRTTRHHGWHSGWHKDWHSHVAHRGHAARMARTYATPVRRYGYAAPVGRYGYSAPAAYGMGGYGYSAAPGAWNCPGTYGYGGYGGGLMGMGFGGTPGLFGLGLGIL
jgi:hypothetical protein